MKIFLRKIILYTGLILTPTTIMAASPPELAQLKDIHLPERIHWWPLAPGWYVLAAILVIALIFISLLIYTQHKKGRPKREALGLLNKYEDEFLKDNDSQRACARISELLKRVALAYFPREQVASLKGEDWLIFLTKTGKDTNFLAVKVELLEIPFRRQLTSGNIILLFSQARTWIAQRRGHV
ncbi:DUF4381 domain-containing protein [Legionella adelaidensis]|nr:DUF4381 domain-containing protein [Legionella adelaidensis]